MNETQIHRQSFAADDGEVLQYKSWIPSAGFKQTILLLHRGHEHADRWDPIIPKLQLPDTAIFAWEARGHGQSPGRRGHAPGFMTYVRDLETFVTHLNITHGITREQMVVVAHSVGAVVAAAWVHDYAPPIAGLVLATPAFEVKLYVPGALSGCRLMQKLLPNSTIKSYVRGSWLTRDPKEMEAYDADKSISKDISARVLVELFDTSRRVIADAGVIHTPLLLLSAGDDSVVKPEPQNAFFDSVASHVKEHKILPLARHAIFHDVCRDEVCETVRTFLELAFAQSTVRKPVTEPNKHTQREFDWLRTPASITSPKHLGLALYKLSLKTMGKLSEGVRLGWKTGFDSGESLDYVYENKARGTSPLGWIIDRTYLNAIGWRGIRQRREMMRSALKFAMASVSRNGEAIQLTDIAGGGGRYLMDLLETSDQNLNVKCRDWSEGALQVGRDTAKTKGLENRIQFEKGDAFDEANLAALNPKPDIGVVSGLYELFPDNTKVFASLKGLSAALPQDGLLVYTNQPWHPQVEMIARVLTNRDGQPWIMRRRPQGEMDDLVKAAGLEKIRQWTDDFGIFTVAVARKPKF